jgi:hypothetical protein
MHDAWHARSERDARQALGLPCLWRRTGAVEFLTKAAVQQAIGRGIAWCDSSVQR